jgi:hypothetical protein
MVKYAVAVTATMLAKELNCSAHKAAEYVAELLKKCDFKLYKNSYATWRTVEEWRHEMRRSSRRDRKFLCQQMLAGTEQRFDLKRAELVTRLEIRKYLLGELLRVMASFYRPIGASKDKLNAVARALNAPLLP